MKHLPGPFNLPISIGSPGFSGSLPVAGGACFFQVWAQATFVTFDTLSQLTQDFASIPSVGRSLSTTLVQAKDAAARGNALLKLSLLTAYKRGVTAQVGKAFTRQQATILIQQANSL